MHNIETRSQNFANGRHPWVPAKLSSYLYPCPSPRIFFSLVAWNGILYWSLLLLEDNLQIITYAELFLRSDGGHSPLSLTPLTISYRINRGSPAGRRCPQASMYDVRHSALVTRLHRKFVIQSTEKKTSPVVAGAMYWMSESVTDWLNEWMNEWMVANQLHQWYRNGSYLHHQQQIQPLLPWFLRRHFTISTHLCVNYASRHLNAHRWAYANQQPSLRLNARQPGRCCDGVTDACAVA